MKESLGNAFVFGFFTIFAFLTLFILITAINYSRAVKIKDRLLTYVQSYAENHATVDGNGAVEIINFDDPEFRDMVDHELSILGYRRNVNVTNTTECPNREGAIIANTSSTYKYCIYARETSRGYYYGVMTYMYFDIPIIGTTLEFPIYGESKIIYNLGDK